mgnify:CR=1 FL=1
MQYSLEGITLAEQLGDKTSLATLYSSTAFSYGFIGDISQSLRYGFKSLELSNQLNDKKRIASAHSALAITYSYLGQYSKSLEHHFETLRLREELGLVNATLKTYNNIGIVYQKIGLYSNAIEYYKRALDGIQKNWNDTASVVRLMLNIGFTEFKVGHSSVAMEYHTKALELAKKINFVNGLAYAYSNLGIMNTEMKNYIQALEYLHQSNKLYEELGLKLGVVQGLNSIGLVYFKIGKYDQAIKYLKQAVVQAQHLNAPDVLKLSYETLYSIYQDKGEQNQAFHYFKLYPAAKDSLFSTNESKKIAELSIQSEIFAREREIELLKKEKIISDLNLEKQKYESDLVIGAVVFLFIVILFLYYNTRRIKQSKILVEQKNDELKILNSELQERVDQVKLLSGLLPICSNCKKIRDDKGYWEQLEGYISKHSEATFSHGICPDCAQILYPQFIKRKEPQ